MPSASLQRMLTSIKEVNILDSPLAIQRLKMDERQVFYHACLAMDVACWDGYINNVIREYHQCIGGIGNPQLLAFRSSTNLLIDRRLEKFNTPNFDNTRNLIIECTGHDPVPNWSWPRRSMIWQAVQQRLNEILKIRHSFAHGLTFPTYNWLPHRSGRAYLNKATTADVESLIVHLASQLDQALRLHMTTQYGNDCTPWPK